MLIISWPHVAKTFCCISTPCSDVCKRSGCVQVLDSTFPHIYLFQNHVSLTNSFKLCPAENTGPAAAFMTILRSSGLSLSAFIASIISSIIFRDKAFLYKSQKASIQQNQGSMHFMIYVYSIILKLNLVLESFSIIVLSPLSLCTLIKSCLTDVLVLNNLCRILYVLLV